MFASVVILGRANVHQIYFMAPGRSVLNIGTFYVDFQGPWNNFLHSVAEHAQFLKRNHSFIIVYAV